MIEFLALKMVLSLLSKGGYETMCLTLIMGLAFTQTAGYVVASYDDTQGNMTHIEWDINSHLDHLYFGSLSVHGNAGAKLSRHKRELAWSDIEKFYADKNNFAMYLVLPLIVLVYGGCAVIYCIARLRRFLKNKKKKKHDQDDFSEDAVNSPKQDALPPNDQQSAISTITNNNNNQPSSMQREGAKTSEVSLSVDHSETPLPWQVPDEKEPLFALETTTNAKKMSTAAMTKTMKEHQQPLSQNGYTNKGFDADSMHSNISPPPYNAQPVSRPPPYRRDSVDEIITLDESEPQNKDRKRKHPSSRSEKVSSSLDDDARERARRLVRGDTTSYLPPASNIGPQNQKSPSSTFSLQTRALSPKYQPPNDDTIFDSVAMAKQAAQLLRLDHNGNQGGGKKSKRLVFVAE